MMNRLNKTPQALAVLIKKDWMNYALELPTVLFSYMQPASEAVIDAKLASRLEALEGLSILDWSEFSATNLLHLDDNLRISNEIILIRYADQPLMMVQIINEGVVTERILNEVIFRDMASLYPPAKGSFTVDERIRFFMDKEVTILSSSDHILAFDGISLFSAFPNDFPIAT